MPEIWVAPGPERIPASGGHPPGVRGAVVARVVAAGAVPGPPRRREHPRQTELEVSVHVGSEGRLGSVSGMT